MTETRTTTPTADPGPNPDEGTATDGAQTPETAATDAGTASPAARDTAPPVAAPVQPASSPPAGGAEAALFGAADAKDFQSRWQAIQVGFVDEPKGAVQQADQLVDEVMRRLSESFARERQELERAWSGGDEASTEDLRQAIRRYRSFFNRLTAL